jgi:hypothetical protein
MVTWLQKGSVVQTLKEAQAGRDFEGMVTHLAHSLHQQATHVRYGALTVLSGHLAAIPHQTKELFSRQEPAVPACRCASVLLIRDDYQLPHLPCVFCSVCAY